MNFYSVRDRVVDGGLGPVIVGSRSTLSLG